MRHLGKTAAVKVHPKWHDDSVVEEGATKDRGGVGVGEFFRTLQLSRNATQNSNHFLKSLHLPWDHWPWTSVAAALI